MLYTRYNSEIIYLIFGMLTTFVNYTVYFFARNIIDVYYIIANILAWVIAVLFAYVANRIWVFKSTSKNILYEIWLFVISRIFSLMLETGLLLIAVGLMKVSDFIAKIVLAVIVIILNYVTGKRIVFKRRK